MQHSNGQLGFSADLKAPDATDIANSYAFRDNTDIKVFALSSVPEPASFTLLTLGLASLAGAGYVRRKKQAV